MPRKPYAPEFKEQLVELALSGRSVASLAREFEPTEATIDEGQVGFASLANKVLFDNSSPPVVVVQYRNGSRSNVYLRMCGKLIYHLERRVGEEWVLLHLTIPCSHGASRLPETILPAQTMDLRMEFTGMDWSFLDEGVPETVRIRVDPGLDYRSSGEVYGELPLTATYSVPFELEMR